MKGFEPVTLSWAGQEYTVPATEQLMLIAEIEDALTRHSTEQAITILLRPSGPSHSRLASAFGAALRYAGADVSDAEIYLSIQEDLAAQSADVASKVQAAVLSLLSIISPPIANEIKGHSAPKKEPAAKA